MGLDYQAVNVKAPQKRAKNTDGSANTVTSVRLYSVTAASQANALPDGWPGKYVHITAETADLTYYFSESGSDVVDNTVAGTADGTSADGTKLGGKILAGQSRDVVVPHTSPGGNGQIFFVRQGSANGNARLELASD